MLEVSRPELIGTACRLVNGADLPKIPSLPSYILQVETAAAFAESLKYVVSDSRDRMGVLMLVDGLPGAGKTQATEALKTARPDAIVYPMDWRIKQPETINERAKRLFDDFQRFYCADERIVQELAQLFTQLEGRVTVKDAYVRTPNVPPGWQFEDIDLNINSELQNREVILEGAGVTMLAHQMKKVLAPDQVMIAHGLVVVDLRTAILSALLRDIKTGQITDLDSLSRRCNFRIQDTATVFEKRGFLSLIQDPPQDLIALNNQVMFDKLIGSMLDQAA